MEGDGGASENSLKTRIEQACERFSGVLHPNIGTTWFVGLEREFQKSYFLILSVNVFFERERYRDNIHPEHDQVFRWTRYFDVKDTKVVILGKEPYQCPWQADGFCYSLLKGKSSSSPSSDRIFEALSRDIEGFTPPSHKCLEGWAKQGVLLLNTCLTIRRGEARSHEDFGWETFTDAVLKLISNECSGVVFLLWGPHACKKASVVDGKKHHLLKASHPLSKDNGFKNCKHFSQCNQLLQKQGKTPIDWSNL